MIRVYVRVWVQTVEGCLVPNPAVLFAGQWVHPGRVLDEPNVAEAERLFLDTLGWLGTANATLVFYQERDVVYTLQRRLCHLIERDDLPWTVFNDYPMLRGPRRAFSADLALLCDGDVGLAVEFKYEPCHKRGDILRQKFPVTVWSDITKDTLRVGDFVAQGRAAVAYAVCIDEGGYLARRDVSIFEEHLEWHGSCHPDHPIAVFIHREPAPSSRRAEPINRSPSDS
jgi:hypothetical protein